MPRVPDYQQSVQQRPIFQSELSANASPNAFGASIGAGMQRAAQGLSNMGDSFRAVAELEDVARAKEADNSFANWARERMYGDGGFMTLEGRNAVDTRKAFEDEAEQKRKEFGQNLRGGAAQAYQNASQARLQSIYQQSIVHTAEARKSWFKDASTARISTFADDALVNYNKPALVTKNMAAGIAELREAGHMQGWDADTLKARESEFVSGIHKNIALRLAQDDPLAADAYMKKNADHISGSDQYALRNTLDSEIKSEQSKREAEAILSSGREVSSEGPAAQPAGRTIAGRTIGQAGPSRARAYLIDRAPGKGASAIDGLDEAFATNLAAMMQDAPPKVRDGLQVMSGFRSIEHQRELFNKSDKSGHMVARPGHSNHNFGRAVDLMWNGQTLKPGKVPSDVLDWVHQNAGKYGLYFRMSWEPWHIEPSKSAGDPGPTVEAKSNTVSARASMPSYDDIESRLANISDPDVRDLARKRVYAAIEAQSKAQEAREKAAKAQLWSYVDQGMTPDQVPMEVRQEAGMSAVSSAWSYMETAAKGRAVDSDETLLYDMRRYAATNPTDFANVDLNDYRDRLSKEAIKELTDKQSSALTDQRKAREDGLNLTSAFSQASTQLEAVGITTTDKKGQVREDAAKRIAQFQNALAAQMDEFKRANDNRAPTQVDIQSMINRLLLPVVIRDEKSTWNPTKTPWSSTWDRNAFLFETQTRPDRTSVEIAVQYSDIPIELRNGISLDLERELGRQPSADEVVQRYEDFVLGRDPTPIVEPKPEDNVVNQLLRPFSYLPGKAFTWTGEGLEWAGNKAQEYLKEHEKEASAP
jgi:LAS superfamily LD-carboxypeptidase LdcB